MPKTASGHHDDSFSDGKGHPMKFSGGINCFLRFHFNNAGELPHIKM